MFSLIANASYFISALFSLPCSVLFFLFLFQFFFWYCLCVFNLFFNYFCGWFFHWNRARLLSPCFLAELPVPVPVHQATVAGSVRGHCLSLNEQHELPPSQVFPIDQHFFECISFLLGDNFWHGDLFTNEYPRIAREFRVDNSSHWLRAAAYQIQSGLCLCSSPIAHRFRN